MGLRRGFKAEADRMARDIRRELNLAAHERLCPKALAADLCIPIYTLETLLADEPDAVNYLRSPQGQFEFSAVTIFDGSRRVIVHNDSHSPKRQVSNLIHELSHGLLLHPPKPPFDASGNRHYDDALEEEANWLGPALLISQEAAMHIAEQGYGVSAASNLFNVTEDIIRMRLNVCGVHKRLAYRSRSH